MVGMEGREEEEKEEEKMSTGVKIETNEIDGWTEKEATETKNPGGTRRRRRRTRRKQKIREEFDLLVWRPRKTSPHHA